ncbi:MAG: hypothetical protein Q9187_000380, partial [Circinaria calcarea]
INEKMRLVKFSSAFKMTMTTVMILDYVGCYVIEKGLKYAFSDYRPKDIAVRRPDQIKAEEARRALELSDAQKEKEVANGKA